MDVKKNLFPSKNSTNSYLKGSCSTVGLLLLCCCSTWVVEVMQKKNKSKEGLNPLKGVYNPFFAP
jgi:hypothetical protein